MAYGVKLRVWGKYALFCRPEFKVERYSYDVITPSAARGILDAIYYHPGMMWKIDRITVLKPISFITKTSHIPNGLRTLKIQYFS